MIKFFAELTGAFFLTITVGLAPNPLAVGLVLSALVYLFSDVSGSHFNPAVTLACWVRDEISMRQMWSYMIAQISGTVPAAVFVWWISDTNFVTAPDIATGTYQFIGLELVLSAFFILVYLGMMFPARRRKNPAFGLMIGLAFGACYLIAESITGTGLNPAMTLAFIAADTLNNGYSYYYLPVYLMAPLLAGLAAAFIHSRIINPEAA